MYDNQLTGSLPEQWSALTGLDYMWVVILIGSGSDWLSIRLRGWKFSETVAGGCQSALANALSWGEELQY
jgi:hypothetical protein